MQVEKIIDDIEAPGPLTRSKASHLSNFCGHYAFVSITEPTKVDEAFLEPEWIQAMQEELHQFELNNVWELVKRPDPRKHNIIGTKWIYRNKKDENGLVVRNKARLVAQGYTQVLKIQRILTKSSDSTRPSMASRRPLGRGMILSRNSS